MIRGDLLHAKTTQVSAQHQREVSSLGRIRERESNARSDVQRREQRFWREVSHATVSKTERRGSRAAGARGEGIERALRAYHLLLDAKERHHSVSGELRDQVSKVIKTKYAVEAFSQMRQRHRVRCESRRVERSGEQVDEVLAVRAARRPLAPARAADAGLTDVREVREVVDRATTTELPVAGLLSDTPRPAWSGELSPARSGDTTIRITQDISLHTVRFDSRSISPTLTVSVEHSGSPLVCRLVGAPSGEMGVVVGAAHPGLSEKIERYRPGLMARLSELGIKVSSLEVRRDHSLGTALGGSFRRGRRSREEHDENTIA